MLVFTQSVKNYRTSNDAQTAQEATLAECMDLGSAGMLPDSAPAHANHLMSVLERFWEIKPEELPDGAAGLDYSREFSRDGQAFRMTMIRARDGNWQFEAGTLLRAERMWPDVQAWEPLAVEKAAREAEAVPETAAQPPPKLGEWVESHVPARTKGTTFLLKDWQWIGLVLIVLASVLCDRLLAWLFVRVLSRWMSGRSDEDPGEEARVMERPFGLAVMAAIWWAGISSLNLPQNIEDFLGKVAILVLAIAAVWISYRMVDVVCVFLARVAAKTTVKLDDLIVPMLRKTMKIFVAVFGIVFVAGNIGIDIRTMLTGLGIGGVAIALASKDTVENLFGSFTVLLDRPFRIGDHVKINEMEGWVEEVGFRSTRIRTPMNSIVTVPNSKLVGAFIDNYGPHTRRPFQYTLGVKEGVPVDRIEQFRDRIRALFPKADPSVREPWQVFISDIGGAATKIQVQGSVRAPNKAAELSERERLLMQFKREAIEAGVELV